MSYSKNLGKRLADFNSKYYSYGIRAQCVWYVQGRLWEKTGLCVGALPDAKNCYKALKSKGLKATKYPRSNTIACFNGGQWGHVIFIEYVIGDILYYTEANSNADNAISSDDGILKRTTVTEFLKRSNLQGFVGAADKFDTYRTTKKIALRKAKNVKKKNVVGSIPQNAKIKTLKGSRKEISGRVYRKALYKERYYWIVVRKLTGQKTVKEVGK